MKLYELPARFHQLDVLLEIADGELNPELEQVLNSLECALEEKTDGICGLIQHLLGNVHAAKAEAKRLEALALIREKAATRLKLYLMENIKKMGRTSVETPLFRVRIQANSRPSISWPGEIEDLPVKYLRIKQELDGNAVYNAWRTGENLPEGFLVELGQHLRIS